jgi:hypothetical protein
MFEDPIENGLRSFLLRTKILKHQPLHDIQLPIAFCDLLHQDLLQLATREARN